MANGHRFRVKDAADWRMLSDFVGCFLEKL